MSKRFSNDEIEYIRHLRSVGFLPADLAVHFDTSSTYIIQICSGVYRRKAPGVITFPKLLRTKAYLTANDKQTIRQRRAEGTLVKVLAIDYDCHEGTISRICGSPPGKRRAK